jgi:tripartite-type tricarboxylate transporter receptor subunit TctC
MVTVTAKQIWAKGRLAACALLLTTTTVLADDFPSRPLRVVVPYAAGGPSDTGTRLAAEPLSRELGKPVVIENRGGGGGLNATEAYFKTEPDGYTILVGSIGPLTIIPTFKPVGYDVDKDVVPLSTVWRSAQCSRCGPRSASRPWPNSSPTRRPIPRRSPSARLASAR